MHQPSHAARSLTSHHITPRLLPLPAGELVVEANSEEVRQATISPKYGALLSAPPPGATAAVPLVAGASGRCMRSPHCTKAAGHPGFCSGPKAAAAAAAKAAAAAASRTAAAVASAAACHHVGATSEGSLRGAAAATDTSGEEALTRLGTPRAAARSTADADAKLPEGLHEIAYVPAGLRLTKALTGYDLTSRRIVMPVPEVEAGIANSPSADLLTLGTVDESQRWRFPTLRAWTNVAGRRGYLLDGLADWLAARGAEEGDRLAIYRDSDLTPPVRAWGSGGLEGRCGAAEAGTACLPRRTAHL